MYKSILVPTDGSPLSDKAVSAAINLAKDFGATLTALHVMPGFHPDSSYWYLIPDSVGDIVKKRFEEETVAQSKKIVDKACTESAAVGVACKGVSVTSDSPHEAIIRQAKKSKCNLIVMASHGRRGLDALVLGSETHKVLVHSRIRVLVVR